MGKLMLSQLNDTCDFIKSQLSLVTLRSNTYWNLDQGEVYNIM